MERRARQDSASHRRFRPFAAWLVVASLLPLLLTSAVPRECFDSHDGTDYDLYCRLYYNASAQDTAHFAEVVFNTWKLVEVVAAPADSLKTAMLRHPLAIRAPPPPRPS